MNTEYNEEQQLEVESSHPGQTLKNARIALGLSEQDVADRLRLRITVIRELEENCCNESQIATFTRGYIRSYAKLVGLDAEELLAQFQVAPQIEDNAQKMQSFSRKTRREQHDSRVMGLTWLILAVAVGITSFWWWQNQQGEQSQIASQSTVMDVVQVNSPDLSEQNIESEVESRENEESNGSDVSVESLLPVASAPEAEIETDTADTPKTSIVEVTEMPAESAAVIESPSAPEQPEQIIPSVTLPTLSLTFEGDCWVDIRDSSGKRLLTGIKSAGETVDLSGQTPFKIVLGAPTVVNVEFNGEKVDLSGYPSGRVARLTLPK